jgi:hypothetical protein
VPFRKKYYIKGVNMAKVKKSEDVPKAMQEKFDRIVALTDRFAK